MQGQALCLVRELLQPGEERMAAGCPFSGCSTSRWCSITPAARALQVCAAARAQPWQTVKNRCVQGWAVAGSAGAALSPEQ